MPLVDDEVDVVVVEVELVEELMVLEVDVLLDVVLLVDELVEV